MAARPAKSGAKWTPEEHTQFLNELKSGKSFEEIGQLHTRTAIAIEKRAQTVALGLKKAGKTDAEVAAEMMRPEAEIAKLTTVREPKDAVNAGNAINAVNMPKAINIPVGLEANVVKGKPVKVDVVDMRMLELLKSIDDGIKLNNELGKLNGDLVRQNNDLVKELLEIKKASIKN